VNDLEIDNKLFRYDVEEPKVVVNKLFEPTSPRLRMIKNLSNINANL